MAMRPRKKPTTLRIPREIPAAVGGVIRELHAWLILHEEARALSNEASRQKTVLKTSMENCLAKGDLKLGDTILFKNKIYGYGPHTSKVISAKKWHQFYLDKEISLEEFLSAISVSKAEAERVAGSDQIVPLLVENVGKTSDIRTISEVEGGDDKEIKVLSIVKKRKTNKVSGRRKIKLRRSK